MSNTTVLYFDDKTVYENLLTISPELKKRRSLYIYFKYNEYLLTSTNISIDCRNNSSTTNTI